MKKVRALDLFMTYDRSCGEFNFYCGKCDSKKLIDLKGMKFINNDVDKLAQKGVDLFKIWNDSSYVEDRVFASINPVTPLAAKKALAEGFVQANFDEVSTTICDVTDILYSVDNLLKIERKINKGLEK